MKSNFLETPGCMNMGFHYSGQYSRRSRVNVMGLVDHSTEEWSRWYLKMHEPGEMKKMAAAGYDFMEIHFLYGFGLKAEKEEIELTKKMVDNAHSQGLKVLGYFQFFSVQEELFFLENPWAKECVQIKSDGTRHEYAYDRPALCFTHKKVQDYYLKGIELGLKYCGLDGIRLDNDYYLGCYCEKCQQEFRKYLKKNFSAELARRVFGFEDLSGMSLVKPGDIYRGGDPLWSAMIKFRQEQRQKIMKIISDKLVSIKPDGILGGNPAVGRKPDDTIKRNFYVPDFGKTHHLICAENNSFPGITGNSIRHQVEIYKYGQSNNFKVFPSHHLFDENNRTRWPESVEECMLSFCEALCFGGHTVCSTWGIRMDPGNGTLYERKHFTDALRQVKKFLNAHKNIYKSAECAADLGIYINRESMIGDNSRAWHSLQGTIQLLLANHIPFRFIDRDGEENLKGLKLLIVPDVRLVSSLQFKCMQKFLNKGRILLTGEGALYDEFFLRRKNTDYEKFTSNKNLLYIKDTYEKINPSEVEYTHGCYIKIPMPEKGRLFIKSLEKIYLPPLKIKGSKFIAVDFFKNEKNENFVHLVNYDNKHPADFELEIKQKVNTVDFYYPENFGPASKPSLKISKTSATLKINKLHTYMIIKLIS